MKLILIATIIFVLYELVKLAIFNKFWEFTFFNKNRNLMLIFIESMYIIYAISLLFTDYWSIGLGVLVVSIITSIKLKKEFDKNKLINNNMIVTIILDSILSLILLFTIIVFEFNK